jgi:hypothetical protein
MSDLRHDVQADVQAEKSNSVSEKEIRANENDCVDGTSVPSQNPPFEDRWLEVRGAVAREMRIGPLRRFGCDKGQKQ